MLDKLFDPEKLEKALQILRLEFPRALWETFYVTVSAAFFAILIGLPLGVLLVTGAENGIRPLPRPLMKALNGVINILRSVPFVILIVVVFPLTRLLVGTIVGTTASIVPLVIAAFPFVARLAESSLREVSPNTIEMAQSLGASPFQIVTQVMIPESLPSLISNAAVAVTTILGYCAMSGIIGGGGLGKLAIDYGYYRYQYLIMALAVILLVVLVQIFQSIGSRLAARCDKRLKR